ncbi:MAG TPA: tRNA pseudouridine(38-40) synthase TruA [Mariprofundaceae bacterium]|nr:tRNA pseudouridine(38-40) synthase TruA [Mariprofundaceae bacterium]
MQRIAMVVEFDGKLFHGWQRQENASSVQAEVEDALIKIERVEGKLVAAGRTDAGVHAEALLVHADVCRSRWHRSPRAYTQGLNQLLPEGVCVTGVRAVSRDFHARFDCLERRYRYKIWNRSTPSAIHRWRHWWVPRAINLEAMQEATRCLLGRHDFTSFRAAGCQAATAVREVRHLTVQQRGWEITIDIHADAFLYHMVRNIVGSLVQVGTGGWRHEKMVEVLKVKDRSQAAATAPAHGLYFSDAIYPDFTSSELIGKELG